MLAMMPNVALTTHQAGSARDAKHPALPDILLLGTHAMPSLLSHRIRDVIARPSPPRLLVLSLEAADGEVARLFRSGIRGFLSGKAQPEDLAKAIRVIHGGGLYIESDMQQAYAERYLVGEPEVGPNLSNREHQVLALLAVGNKCTEIADKLNISIKTVNTHRAALLRKLDLRNNADLTRFAIRNNLITP